MSGNIPPWDCRSPSPPFGERDCRSPSPHLELPDPAEKRDCPPWDCRSPSAPPFEEWDSRSPSPHLEHKQSPVMRRAPSPPAERTRAKRFCLEKRQPDTDLDKYIEKYHAQAAQIIKLQCDIREARNALAQENAQAEQLCLKLRCGKPALPGPPPPQLYRNPL